MMDDAIFTGPRAGDSGWSDDAELLRRYAAEKSEAAFAELVRRHLDLVYSTALRRLAGDTHLAQDVAQAVFTALARKAASLTGRTALAGWLYLGAHHAAAQAVRGEQRRHARESEASTMYELYSSTAAATDWDRVRPVLDDALRELNEPDREAVLLRFFEQRPFAEIGAALRVTEDAARRRVDRALEKLRARLERSGVTSTAAALAAALAGQVVVAAPAGLAAAVSGAAFAGAATGGAALAATGFFMKTSTAILGAVALAAIGTTVYELNQNQRAAADVARLTSERTNLQSTLSRVQQRVQQSDDDLVAMRKELGDLRANTAKAGVAPPPAAPAARAGTSHNAAEYALDHPEARAAFVESEVLRARARFERFFQQAQLSPAAQEQFMKNLRDYTEGKLDFLGAMRPYDYNIGNMPHDPATVAQTGRLEKQVSIDLLANMHSLLGDDAFRQFQQYVNTVPIRNVVDDVASRLYDSAAPLTAAQADQLTGILALNPFRTPVAGFQGNTAAGTFIPIAIYNGAKTQMNIQGGSTLTDWHEPVSDAALARAATVLTPAQFAALRSVQEQQVAQLLSMPPVRTPDMSAKKIQASAGK